TTHSTVSPPTPWCISAAVLTVSLNTSPNRAPSRIHRRNRPAAIRTPFPYPTLFRSNRPPRLRARPDGRIRLQRVPGRGTPRHRACRLRIGALDVGAVLHRVGEVGLFGRHLVPQAGLHVCASPTFFRFGELRDRDRGQDADD